MTSVPSLGIDRLIRRNRIQPRSYFPPQFELVALEVHLEERGLKGILGHLRTARVTVQVAVQFSLVPPDQLSERLPISGLPVPEKQFLVGQ
jgi:hypothetical protein